MVRKLYNWEVEFYCDRDLSLNHSGVCIVLFVQRKGAHAGLRGEK